MFAHSESNAAFCAVSAFYEPYPQLLLSHLASIRDDWSQIVMPAPIVVPGIYRHFKGGIYRALGEFMRPNRDRFVVYMAMYEPFARLARPLGMFTERVVKPEHKYEGPRFTLIRPC